MNHFFNHSIQAYNTFGVSVKANEFVIVSSLNELKEVLLFNKNEQTLFLGGGSNMLFTQNFDGLIIKNEIKGKYIQIEDENNIEIKFYSGENWHETVMFSVEKGYSGIENLSLIPGTVGAAPMQNIGAYGVELESVFVELEALNLKTLELETFNHNQCEFGYRESVFKRKLKNQYFIFSVTLKLSKHFIPKMSYGDIQNVLHDKGIIEPKIKDVSDAVIQIRQSKLPDPKVLGNSGSFFKNPTISSDLFNQLKSNYPEIKGFTNEYGVKIPAAWLIENTGWKGKRIGNTGSHAKQALVLVNYGGATGSEVKALAYQIIESVQKKFNITLEPEVNIY